MSFLASSVAAALTTFVRLLTGAQARWLGCAPAATQRIYFGNHASHADFILIWSSLPPDTRANTRPVAGADYWEQGRIRRFLIRDVINAVLIDRNPATRVADPIKQMVQALGAGYSLILFPEGTRNMSDAPLLPFKAGIYRVATERPDIDLVPVWIDNVARVLPKGALIPIPLLCSVNFGEPLRLAAGEAQQDFLHRAREALLALAASVQARPD